MFFCNVNINNNNQIEKIAISITPQYHKILQYLDINIDIWLGNGIITQPWSQVNSLNASPNLTYGTLP